jgi:hypothetical protein
MTNQRLPQYFRFIIPIIDVLKELESSGRASEVTDLVVEKLSAIVSTAFSTLSERLPGIKRIYLI